MKFEIVVRHEFPEVKQLADAIVRAAEIRRGFHDPQPPADQPPAQMDPIDRAFEAFMLAQTIMPELQRKDLRATWQVFRGKRPAPEGFDKAERIQRLIDAGSPLPF